VECEELNNSPQTHHLTAREFEEREFGERVVGEREIGELEVRDREIVWRFRWNNGTHTTLDSDEDFGPGEEVPDLSSRTARLRVELEELDKSITSSQSNKISQ